MKKLSIRQRFMMCTYPLLIQFPLLSGKGKKILHNRSAVLPPVSFYTLKVLANDGTTIDLGTCRGKKVMIINLASDCGFTPQYDELEKLHRRYHDCLVLLGCPSNDFGGQEPGSDAAIAQFCRLYFDVSFQLLKKASVLPPGQHPLYQWLTDPAQNGWNAQLPSWNFCKYLVDEKGQLMHFFSSTVSPLDPAVIEAVRS